MPQKSVTWTIGKQKNIALIAHDSQKPVIIQWCEEHKDILKEHFLHGTGTTARMITDRTGLPVRGYNSGPLGGDLQIGAKIVEGKIDFVIFYPDIESSHRVKLKHLRHGNIRADEERNRPVKIVEKRNCDIVFQA